MALITLDPGEYVYFNSDYVSHLTDEDSGGFVVQYERLNLVDSNLINFNFDYVSHLTDEDSAGFVVQYERLNLVDSNLINFVTMENYYIENSVEEEIIKVDYGEAAQKERWR